MLLLRLSVNGVIDKGMKTGSGGRVSGEEELENEER